MVRAAPEVAIKIQAIIATELDPVAETLHSFASEHRETSLELTMKLPHLANVHSTQRCWDGCHEINCYVLPMDGP